MLNGNVKDLFKFERVSEDQFLEDCEHLMGMDIRECCYDYNAIQLPRASTPYSAGFDFCSPLTIDVPTNQIIWIPTGIRWVVNHENVAEAFGEMVGLQLQLYPRSGLSTKFGIRLANTVGIVDSDYSDSDNEGHIILAMIRDMTSVFNPPIFRFPQGDRVAQGIVQPYIKNMKFTKADASRNGGFGSTGK